MSKKLWKTRSIVVTGSVALLAALLLALALSHAGPVAASQPSVADAHPLADPGAVVTATILHTNDFHGRLESELQRAYTGTKVTTTGSAYVAAVVDKVRAEQGEDNVALLDAGDAYFAGQPVSQLLEGESTIDIYNRMGYDVAEYGNHEFDHGQSMIVTRSLQSEFPWIGANIVISGTDWDQPTWVQPFITKTVGTAGHEAVLGIIGVDTQEVPYISIKGATDGLIFKDPTATIEHYYPIVAAKSDAVIVLAHIGTADTVNGKGLRTIARELNAAGLNVPLMIGGHAHEPLEPSVVVSGTTIVEAGSYGYWVGRVDVSIDTAAKTLTVGNNQLIKTLNAWYTPDADIAARVAYWKAQVAPKLAEPVGVTNINLTRGDRTDSVMGNLVSDGMKWKADMLDDGAANGSVDLAFTNAGGLRADITPASLPYTITWGDTFTVLPFGNTLFMMNLKGSEVQELLDQACKMATGMLQSSGATWYCYNNKVGTTVTAWGAYGVTVNGKPLNRTKSYRIVTNNFLATGGDNFATFNKGTNRVDLTSADMQAGVNDYIKTITPIDASDIPGNRVKWLDKVVTVLHTNDLHGTWDTTMYQGNPEGMVYLASLIKAEKAHNPNALLLDGGDAFQGNSFAYFYRNLNPNPIAQTFNELGYSAFTLGNHEFNFGSHSFTTTLSQLTMPILAANLHDDGSYSHGFITDNVKSYINLTVDGVKVSLFGLTNPRVPRYELPTNIQGLSFAPATATAISLVPQIKTEEKPDVLLGLTHIGYAPYSDEPDSDVLVSQQVAGIDAIIGAHSHTTLNTAVVVTSTLNPTGTLVAQTGSNAMRLGKVNIGLTGNITDGFKIVLREGYLENAAEVYPAKDPAFTTFLQPFLDEINAYNATEIGQTHTMIDATTAYTRETNGANLQADAAIHELTKNGIAVDFHISGAMSNKKVAVGASPTNPYTLTVGDMFNLMPYENSLVVLRMNGPQLKTVLERGYRNYYYYKYDRSHAGSYYTTCMLDTNHGVKITYADNYPQLPNGNNVVSLEVNGTKIDFNDANTYYKVGTVNYLAAGSCNFNDAGQTLWPISQITADTQFYVRDSVVDYVKDQTGPINPQVEGRLSFLGLRGFTPVIRK